MILAFIDLGWSEYAAKAGEELIATICHDDTTWETQPWVVYINRKEVHRANTLIKAQNWCQYHFKNCTLPKVQLEEVAVTEVEVGDRVVVDNELVTVGCAVTEEDAQVRVELRPSFKQVNCNSTVMRQATTTKTKLAKDLEVGDRVILEGQTWELRRKIPQKPQFGWRSVYGVQYQLMLRIAGYQSKKWEGSYRLSAEFSFHLQNEQARLDAVTKWLKPFSEAQFQVLEVPNVK